MPRRQPTAARSSNTTASAGASTRGLSTVFLVLERQTTLVVAQAAEARARADLNQALALLDRAIGGTLIRHGVSIAN